MDTIFINYYKQKQKKTQLTTCGYASQFSLGTLIIRSKDVVRYMRPLVV